MMKTDCYCRDTAPCRDDFLKNFLPGRLRWAFTAVTRNGGRVAPC
jgi:hypothetical protein